MDKKESSLYTHAAYMLLSVLLVVTLFNQYMIGSIGSVPATGYVAEKPAQQAADSVDNSGAITLQEAIAAVIPTGVPAVYGNELSVSFDKPTESLTILSALDGDLYPDGKLKFSMLTPKQLERYKKIGFSIACEYCCGATSLIANDGRPACGCAHSAAMRGLAMYLLTEHENEYTDEQILSELTKWKAMFFPKQMIEKYMQSGSVQAIAELPDMVGGC